MGKNTDSAGVTNARLSIPLTADGLIDMDHMRPSTAQKLIDLIKTDPTIRDTYMEVNGDPDAETPDLFNGLTPENVSKGLDALCTVNAMVFRVAAARLIKHPLLKDAQGKPLPLVLDPDILDKQFGLTAKQHAELDPRAARLAQKYSGKMPAWLKDNLDLYMFGSMFLAYTAENARNVLAAQITRDLARAREAFAQSAAARPRNPQPDTDLQAKQPTNGVDHNAGEFTPPPVSNVPAAPTA